MRGVCALLLLVAVVLLSLDDAGVSAQYPTGLAATRKIKDLTGPGVTDRFGMQATDLGIPCRMSDGRTIYIFGDSFRDARVGGGDWRAPTGLISQTYNLGYGVTWQQAAGGNPNYASQLIPYNHDQNGITTILPADVIEVGGVIYVWVMVNNGFGNVVRCEIWASNNLGKSFYKTPFVSPGNWVGGQLQLITWEFNPADNFVYIYSTGFQRNNPIIMHRVPANQLTNFKAYVPWGWHNNQWNWGNYPTPILEGKFGEMSLRRVDNAWVLCWFDAGDYRVDAIVMSGPVANLYEAQRLTLVLGGAWGQESNTRVAQLYGGYTIPGSTLKDFYFVISQWDTATGWPYHAMQFYSSLPQLD